MSDKKTFPEDSEIVSPGNVPFSHGDIRRVIDDFYTRIQSDPLLKVPFQSVHDWPEHIDRLTHFWWIRFGGRPYLFTHYNPVAKHFHAGFNEEFLSRWLELFDQTLQEHLTDRQRGLWKIVSERMGRSLTMKNELFKREHAPDRP